MSVAKFLRDNIVIVVGVALPLALVLFFVLVRDLPQTRVPNPQYDLIFAKNYPEGRNNRLEFSVSSGKLRVRYFPEQRNSNGSVVNSSLPKLFYFDVGKNAIREISIELPVDDEGNVSDKVQYIAVPEIAGFRVEPGNTAPDGYQFLYNSNRHGGLMTELFVGQRRQEYVLEKEGRRVQLPTDVHYYNTRAIGWVMSAGAHQ